MGSLWRIPIGLVGAFNVLLGLGFLVDPAGMAQRFFLSALGSQGLATVRADFTAFFVVGGACALIAAARGVRSVMLVPIALLGIALTGRLVSLVADGAPATAFPPMIAEAVMIALLAAAYASARGARS